MDDLKITSYEKEYVATMKLGILTDTGDITGKIIKKINKMYFYKQTTLK